MQANTFACIPATPTSELLVVISTLSSVEILELVDIESNSFDFSHFH